VPPEFQKKNYDEKLSSYPALEIDMGQGLARWFIRDDCKEARILANV
jgi:hypothetical protein